jgi:hypothetical protein
MTQDPAASACAQRPLGEAGDDLRKFRAGFGDSSLHSLCGDGYEEDQQDGHHIGVADESTVAECAALGLRKKEIRRI